MKFTLSWEEQRYVDDEGGGGSTLQYILCTFINLCMDYVEDEEK